MKIQELGHVVVKVRDAQRAEHFYAETLGIPVAGRSAHPVPMVFFTLGHHHDFAVMELGKNGPSPDRHAAGLGHVAFKVGDSLDEFDATKSELEAAGVVILFELHHAHTKGMHVHDPDANEVELFVDIAPEPAQG
jgi:catechol 2,3-dioxygenase-like lactoylglutathione lyase family enzyme